MLTPDAPPLVPTTSTPRRLPRRRALLAGAGVATCLAVGLLDPATAPFPPCPWRAVTGIDCPGCGATRALHALLRGDVVAAADHNLLLVVAVATAITIAVARLAGRRRGAAEPRPRREAIHPALGLAMAAVVLSFWIARVAGPGPLAWLASSAS